MMGPEIVPSPPADVASPALSSWYLGPSFAAWPSTWPPPALDRPHVVFLSSLKQHGRGGGGKEDMGAERVGGKDVTKNRHGQTVGLQFAKLCTQEEEAASHAMHLALQHEPPSTTPLTLTPKMFDPSLTSNPDPQSPRQAGPLDRQVPGLTPWYSGTHSAGDAPVRPPQHQRAPGAGAVT